jgi:hypothetical protein
VRTSATSRPSPAPRPDQREILYDKDTKTYVVNNKSGRYSKHNKDRTPQQLVNATNLIRQVVDTVRAWPGARPSTSSSTRRPTSASS